MKIKNTSTMNITELKNLNKMSDCKICVKMWSKRLWRTNVKKGELELLLLGYVQRKTTVSFIERWARFKNMQIFKHSQSYLTITRI